MFHVELKLIFTLLFSFLAISGCKKPPENPFLGDTIFKDYEQQLEGTKAALAAVEKNIKENEDNILKLPAQSNLKKYHRSKIEDLKGQRVKLKQQSRYWEVKIEERKVKVTFASHKAFYEGKEFALDADAPAYLATKKLRQAKVTWDQKKRVADHKASLGPAPASAGGHGEPPAH